jgi:putative tryptophan/tyrosine transport system substrate-binding protein
VRRRDFILGVTGGAVAWPMAARSQQSEIPTIGYLSSATPAGFAHFVASFRRGLEEAGYVEGRNVGIEFRWAEGQNDRLPKLAADLVGRRVAVIVATGGTHPALAAKEATATIPIVFTGGGDPVRFGLVESLSRPGGNATGVVNITTEITAKRFQLLRELVPAATSIGVLLNPTSSNTDDQLVEIKGAARVAGQTIQVVNASSERDIATAFSAMARQRVGALFVSADSFFTSRRAQLVALAEQHAVPASYAFRDFPSVGGLMSYGANILDLHRQAGAYAGRILNGARPGDLPVLQPTKFELVIKLKTANALSLTFCWSEGPRSRTPRSMGRCGQLGWPSINRRRSEASPFPGTRRP